MSGHPYLSGGEIMTGNIASSGWLRGREWLLALAGLALVQLAVNVGWLGEWRIRGDEGGHLRRSVGLWHGEIGALFHGHFTPGMALLLAPVSWMFDTMMEGPGLVVARYWLSAVSVGLAGLTVWVYRPLLPARSLVIFLVLATLSPLVIFFASRAWSDLNAGYLLAIIVGLNWRLFDTPSPPLRRFVELGALCALLLYFRPNMVLVGPLLFAIWALRDGRNFLNGQFGAEAGRVVRLGLALLAGFWLAWTPWVIGGSLVEGQLTPHPAFSQFEHELQPRTQTWVYSPPEAETSWHQGQTYNQALFDRAVETLREDPEFQPTRSELRRLRRRGSRGNTNTYLSRLAEHAPAERVDEAVHQAAVSIRDEVVEALTPARLVSAISRNLANVYGNPNQFIAKGMLDAEFDMPEDPERPVHAHLQRTHGGQQSPAGVWPAHPVASVVLWFNMLIYYLVFGLAVLIVCTPNRRDGLNGLRLFAVAGAIAFSIMVFVVPGHGRYVSQVYPLALLIVSAGCVKTLPFRIRQLGQWWRARAAAGG